MGGGVYQYHVSGRDTHLSTSQSFVAADIFCIREAVVYSCVCSHSALSDLLCFSEQDISRESFERVLVYLLSE